MDTIYPEPVSQIYRRMEKRKGNSRLAARYRTLPVTFSEIQEVDEENIEEEETVPSSMDNVNDEAVAITCGVVSSKSDHDLKSKFSNHPTLGERAKRNRPTKKSLNRKLLLDKLDCNNSAANRPGIEVTPSSPDSPPPIEEDGSSEICAFRTNLNKPRTSI